MLCLSERIILVPFYHIHCILVHPRSRESTQPRNCSDRRTLICHSRAAIHSERRVGQQVDGQGNKPDTGLSILQLILCILAGIRPLCEPAGTHGRTCCGSSRHKQMFSWVILLCFPCNDFPQGPASGMKCQVVLLERFRDDSPN